MKIIVIEKEKQNRHGHSNSKKSFWAFGYKSLKEMKEKDGELYQIYIYFYKIVLDYINKKKENHRKKNKNGKKI